MKTTNDHIKYWQERKIDWKTQYFDTHGHPHRELILKALSQFSFRSLLEVGCGAGANLVRIKIAFPWVEIGGMDVSADAIETARKNLPQVTHLDTSPAHNIFLSDKSVDVTLTDACLIYVGHFTIGKAIEELKRVSRGHIVLCEFHSESIWQRLKLLYKTGYYAYNYKKLLKRHGFYDVQVKKIPKEAWPGTPWEEHGYIITASL